jgi:hypothetical protein
MQQGGEMNQALYAHMNNKRKMKKKHMQFLYLELTALFAE